MWDIFITLKKANEKPTMFHLPYTVCDITLPTQIPRVKKKEEKGPKRNPFSLKMCQIFICIFWTKQWRFQELLSAVFVCCEEKVEQEEKG